MNSVTLYSNGTAVVRREYQFNGTRSLQISIPVKKSDLDDVITSLSIFGDVAMTSPPMYVSSNAGGGTLTLDSTDVLREIATKLSGAVVEIDAGTSYLGKLLGLHQQRRECHGSIIKQFRLVILTEKGIQQVNEEAITAIRFTDDVIQAEIDKALQANFNQVKPNSCQIGMTLQTNSEATSALVQYAIPVASWKCRYQVRMSASRMELEGHAIVDNDTEDDWTNARMTLVTGEPITFSTDIAESYRPNRKHIHLVPRHTTGAVFAENGLCLDMKMSDSDDETVCFSEEVPDDALLMQAAPSFGSLKQADQAQSEMRESGDFSLFQSPNPITLAAGQSAIIPLFRTEITEAESVLFYNEEADQLRPFRAVRLKNSTTHSLGRGVCEVFQETDFQGKCILESTKPGEEVLLIHAKETGVRVFKEVSRPESRRLAIKISEGTIYYEVLNKQNVVYRVLNSHPKTFSLEIEHPRCWQDSKLSVSASIGNCGIVDIPNGQRIQTTLQENGSLSVTVVEEQLEQQAYSLDMHWLHQSLIEINAPASRSKDLQKCIKLQEEVDRLQSELQEHEEAAKAWEEEQKRLLKLIPAAHAEQANEWRTDLATAEKELREIRKTMIPRLKRQIQEARSTVQSALRSLEFSWKSEEVS